MTENSCSPSLSIVIPAYNAGKTIVRALDSVFSLKSDLPEFEVIVVDDKSSDDTVDIVKRYSTKHDNVFLICQPENHRQGAARNIGLKMARGEYVCFLDSDDALEKGIIPAVKSALSHKCDMLFMGTAWQNAEGVFVLRKYEIPENQVMTGAHFIENYYDVVCAACWAFLWNRFFLQKNDCHFIEDRRMEDIDFIESHLVKAHTIFFSPEASYKYYDNPLSTLHQVKYDIVADGVYQSYRRMLFTDRLIGLYPSFCEKIRFQCLFFISSSLSLRRLTRINVLHINRMMKLIGGDAIEYLKRIEGLSRFSVFALYHPNWLLCLLAFATPMAYLGRYIVHSLKRYV